MPPTRRSLVLAAAALGSLRLAAEGAREILHSVLSAPNYRGQIPSSAVTAIMNAEGLNRDALMLKLLPDAQSHAHPPISHYFVGAVASGLSGSLYFGANIEIPGNPLGLAVHAEQSAIANAYMSNESGIDAIAVRGSPCGHCRQFLSEISLDVSMRVLVPDNPEEKLSDLLPNNFGPRNLGFKQGVFPINSVGLTVDSVDSLVQQALRATTRAYAPYSKSLSGAAILTANGRIFTGSYIENAAFNPSLPPLQTALAGYFAAAPASGQIERAVLLEQPHPTISHLATTKATLAAFAPSATLTSFVVRRT